MLASSGAIDAAAWEPSVSQIVSEECYGEISLFSLSSHRGSLSFNGLWGHAAGNVRAAHEGRGSTGEEMDRVFRATLLAYGDHTFGVLPQ